MKKRISVFIFILSMMVCMLGSVSVYASEVNYSQAKFSAVSTQINCEIPDNVNGGNDYGTIGANHIITSISVDDYGVYGARDAAYLGISYYIVAPKSFSVTVNRNYFVSGFENNDTYNIMMDNSGYTDTSSVRMKSETVQLSSSQYGNFHYVSLGSSNPFTVDNILNVAGSGYVFDWNSNNSSYSYTISFLIEGVLAPYGNDVSKAPNVSIDEYVEEKEPVFSEDLGCLQNIERKVIFKGASGTNQDYRFKYSYAYTTSTGFDLRTDGADVEYCVKIKGGYKTLMGNYVPLPTVKTENFYAGNTLNYFYIDSETFNNLVTSFRTDDVPFTANLSYVEYVYARPIYKDGADVSYGLWAKIYDEDGNYKVDYGTSSDGNVSTEEDGEDDDFNSVGSDDVEESLGTGGDWDDAESNSKPSVDTSVDVDDLMQNAENLVGQIGEIPQLIAVLFSFLPPWCLTLFGIGFGVIVLLIIYKLIRG